MEESNSDTRSPDDIISIMVASDIHLGYAENDPVRGEDSFVAFEEVLALAVEYDVDLVLLGGDLFDHAKPSPATMLRCTRLLRQYCLGNKPVAIEVLSDQFENFSRSVNYEDPDLNVAYPVLSVHGNHDDPVGQGAISSLDILASMGLVNYFGKWSDYTAVRLKPVLLRKGGTRLALYGLGHLKDQRLARLFRDNSVIAERPPDGDDWFNMLVLHQNRADRGHNNFIPEACLPTFLDLTVWGHEHDCRIVEEFNGNFHVTQPGSTVATSLASGEALPKHCALLQIHGKKFTIKPIRLKSVRPFIFRTIVLSEEDLGEAAVNENEKVQDFLRNKVDEAVEEASNLRSGHPHQPELPLVRLCVHYEHEGQDFNRIRFGQHFNGTVANPNDILMMKREKRPYERKGPTENGDTRLEDVVRCSGDSLDVPQLLREYYAGDKRLTLLSTRAMADAVADATAKLCDDSFRRLLNAHLRHAVSELMKAAVDTEEEVVQCLQSCRRLLDDMDDEGLRAVMTAPVVESTPAEETPSRGRRAARGTRSRGRGRGKPAPPSPPPSPARRTPRRSAARAFNDSWQSDAVSSRMRRGSPINIADSD